MSAPIQHIAVIRLSAMGDVAMTVPVLRAFAESYPEVKITMVSRPFFKPFFDAIPNVDFFEFDELARHKGLFGLFRLYADLKMLKVDAFADLHNVLRSKVVAALFRLSGTKTATVDKARAEKKALTRSENKIFRKLKPIMERHAEVFASLGFPIKLSNPKFPEPAILSADETSVTGEKGNLKWIGIAPFAQYESKVYPIDLMQQVIAHLLENPLNKLILFGGKTELPSLQKLAQHQNAVIAAGKLSLKSELSVISNLDVMLSMDSGNAHLAAMFGIPVITLWGATHPYAGFAPFNQPDDYAIVSDRAKFPLLPTSVYGNKKVDGYDDAMRSIPPKVVIGKVLSVI